MTNLDQRLVLALYDWAAGHGAARTLTLFAAQWLVFLIPLVLLAAWWWPPAALADRRRVLVAVLVSAVLGGAATLVLGALALPVTGALLARVPPRWQAWCGLAPPRADAALAATTHPGKPTPSPAMRERGCRTRWVGRG